MNGFSIQLNIALLSLLIFTFPVMSSEFEFSAGAGHQYGGFIGGQFSYKNENSKYYGSVALVGYSVGLQTTFSENSKHSFGATIGQSVVIGDYGFLFLNYDYHIEGFQNKGWVTGVGLGFKREEEGRVLGAEIKTTPSITFDLGYKF